MLWRSGADTPARDSYAGLFESTINNPKPTNHRTLPTKLLHAALSLSVLWQLGASGLVERPRAGQPGNVFYEVHEVIGLITLGLVLAFWLWSALRRRETPLAALFPGSRGIG